MRNLLDRGPEVFPSLRGYTRQQAIADAGAGVIVGVVALPLAIAFAIASGLPPQYGLYTAIVAGFLISALGGSRVQIGGPTGAFVVIVYGIVQQFGVQGLLVATVMAGIMLVAMGAMRLGAAIKFIPFPVTTGFTSAIAVLIFVSQLGDALGLDTAGLPAEFVPRLTAYYGMVSGINTHAVGLAALVVIVLVAWPKVSRKVPAPMIALLLGSAVAALAGLDVATIGSRYGRLELGWPSVDVPPITLELLRALSPAAFTIAILAAIESLLSAVVADGMIGTRHNSNQELIGQGIANMVTPLLGGMPATGAIARTATNIRSGGRTPVAGMVHAVTLLLIMLAFGRMAGLIPIPVLAGILIVVAYHMSEWRTFTAELVRAPRSDSIVMLVTFLLTLLVSLTIALEVAIVLAAFLFMKRMAEVTTVTAAALEPDSPADEAGMAAAEGVLVYEINGPFFFGAAEKFKDTLGTIDQAPHVIILRLRNVPFIDATGLAAFRMMVHRFRQDGTAVMLTELAGQPRAALLRAGLIDEVGEEHVFDDATTAMAAAAEFVAARGLLFG